MDITDYTSYAEIRAICGLSVNELPDEVLSLSIYGNYLSLRMAGITLPDEAPGPGPLTDAFAVVEAKLEADRTAAEQKLYDLTKLFAAYAVANEVCRALPTKLPKAISDSKATLTRFSPESVYFATMERVEAMLRTLGSELENINETTVSPPSFLGIITPAVDVVTDS
jgi:hypothetical protein